MQKRTSNLVAKFDLPRDIEQALTDCGELPSLPTVAMKVLEICRGEKASMRSLAKTIEQDPPLVARILRVVNSGLFGLSRQIGSITQAVNMLGIRKTKIVVLGFSVLNREQGSSGTEFDVARHWGKAISSAIAAQLLATRTRAHSPEEAFVAGLLQDIGILALWRVLPLRYGPILADHGSVHGMPLSMLEHRHLGVDHAAVGAWLLDRWQLPDALIEAVRNHHGKRSEPAPAGSAASLSAMLQLADAMSTLVWRKEPGRHDLWRDCPTLGLAADQQEEIILETRAEYDKVSEACSLRENPTLSVPQLIDAARAELAALALDSAVEVERQERRTSKLQATNQKLAGAFQQWEQAAKRDPLTGLANRMALDAYLQEGLTQMATSTANLGLIILDLDHFKEINDTYGHLVGDRALCAVADVLRAQLREKDLAARFGGDEFLVVLPNVTLPLVMQVAGRLHKAIGDTLVIAGPARFSLTASVGVASGERIPGPVTYQALLDAADRSLYDAKLKGRDRVGLPLPT